MAVKSFTISRADFYRAYQEGRVQFEYEVLPPLRRRDSLAYDYAWHFDNHDPGDEDRSEG